MQFIASPAIRQMPSVLPLLGVALLPALLVLAMACFSLSREEETIRLPSGTLARPPVVRDRPTIEVRLSRQGAVTLAGQAIADGDLAAAWQRERGALRLLGCEPSQATVVIRADADLPTDKVQQLMEKAQAAGFSRCVLRADETGPAQAQGSATQLRGTKP
jgi:biopolymer transport protein ExbD